MATRIGSKDAQLPNWLFPAIFSGVILAYWAPRMGRGFWIDEATTYWIDQGGWAQAWLKLQSFPGGQSYLYQSLISPLFLSDGSSKEAMLRLPSLAGMLVAGWLLYKLTENILGRGSGWLAIVPFASTPAIIETATSARPYALALAVTLASFWSLREWVHTGRNGRFALYCIASALVLYFHFLFALIFAVQTVYLVAAYRAGWRFSWRQVLLAAGAIAIGALPLLRQLFTLAHHAGIWKSAVKPTLATFLSFFPLQAVLGVAIGLVLFFVLHREWFSKVSVPAHDDTVLLVTWVLLGPLVMFILERTTSRAVFSTRYVIYALPAFFILLAWCIYQIQNQRAQFALVLALAATSALYVRGIGANTPEWRTPLRLAGQIAGIDTPILLRSAHVDGVGFDLRTEPNPASYYFAQLAPYPVRNEIIPVPFFLDAVSEGGLEQEIKRREPAHRRFCLIADQGSDALEWLPAWFRTHGYTVETRDAAGIEILSFQR